MQRRKYQTERGFYRAKNPQKYKGNPLNIVYRSSWERKLFNYLDANPSILEWSSEEIVIPYMSPLDNEYHRYFPDVWARVQTSSGKVRTVIFEVKPFKETQMPVKKKRVTKALIREVTTYAVNHAKWEAAREYCADKGWEFKLLTEYELGIKS